jgi:hypothetical protein
MAKRVSIEERILEYFRENSGLPAGELMFNLVRAEIVRGREITAKWSGKGNKGKKVNKKPAGKKSANLATVGGGSSGSRRRPSEGDAEDAARSIGTGG